jgi:hypothetical protein
MRKLIVVAGLALLVAAPVALAKERNVQLLGTATSAKQGRAWNVTISVKVDGKLVPGKTPAVRIISPTGRVVTVSSHATARLGIYRADVVFPRAGTWRVVVIDRESGRAYEFGRMRVLAA